GRLVMTVAGASRLTRALAVRGSRELSDSMSKRRSVRSSASKQWQPPEGLAPDDVWAVIDAAPSERDRLRLRVLWASGEGPKDGHHEQTLLTFDSTECAELG